MGKWSYVYRKIDITQRFNTEDAKQTSQSRVTFYFWNLEFTPSYHRFVLHFLLFAVDLTFGKILNIWEYSHSRGKHLPQLTCKRIHFCKCAGECPLIDAEQNSQKKPVTTLFFILKVLVIWTRFELAWWRLLISGCLSCHKNLGLDQENAHQ